MAKLWVVIKREYLERVRSKWFIFTTIFGPVFFACITILPGYMTMKGMKNAQVSSIRILDATGSGLGHRVAARLATKRDTAGAGGNTSPLRARTSIAQAVPDVIPSEVEDVN